MASLAQHVDEIRQDFPYLEFLLNDKPIVYLDNAATTQKPRQVLDAMHQYYSFENANPHRGAHFLTTIATTRYEESRARIARFINTSSAEELVFVRNATEAINLVAYTWGLNELHAGDEIVVTGLEHHSNMVPWQFVAQKTGATLKVEPITSDYAVDVDRLIEGFSTNTKLVAITGASNTTSFVPPLKRIIDVAHALGAIVLVDGAQLVPHEPVDVQELDCDFLAFSGHKMLGPMGIGCLYGKLDLLNNMQPFLYGGEMIEYVYEQSSTFERSPMRFEAGTQDVGGVVGLAAACDYLEKWGMNEIHEYELELTNYALERLHEIDFVKLYYPTDAPGGAAITFNIEDVHPHDVATIMDANNVAVRSGHHCAMPLHTALKEVATCRASFAFYNTFSEADQFIDALYGVRKLLGY